MFHVCNSGFFNEHKEVDCWNENTYVVYTVWYVYDGESGFPTAPSLTDHSVNVIYVLKYVHIVLSYPNLMMSCVQRCFLVENNVSSWGHPWLGILLHLSTFNRLRSIPVIRNICAISDLPLVSKLSVILKPNIKQSPLFTYVIHLLMMTKDVSFLWAPIVQYLQKIWWILILHCKKRDEAWVGCQLSQALVTQPMLQWRNFSLTFLEST